MKKLTYLVLPLTALVLSGCVFPFDWGGSTTSKNTGFTPKVIIEEGAYDGYYDDYRDNLNSMRTRDLKREINKMMIETHTTLIRYADFNMYTLPNSSKNKTGYSIDQVSEDVKMNELIYSGKQVAFSSSGYEREHVWPCNNSQGMWVHTKGHPNYVDSSTYVGGGSDLYHVRPSSHYPNNARGNSKFCEFSDEEKESLYYVGDTGTTQGANDGPYKIICDKDSFANKSEPPDEQKGDIARLLAYVYIHYCKITTDDFYEEHGYLDYVSGLLSLSDVIYTPEGTDQSINELIVRWNEMDPVNETEMLRNNTVQKIQGNRNPFVDYPHLLSQMLLGK